MHSHIALPLFKESELLGIWALRTSLRSTNPYTSFSDTEIQLLIDVTVEIVGLLDQVQHFQTQERQERLAALGEMSAALAHEIRNPLGALHGAAHLLRTSHTLAGNEDKECVEIVSKEVERMQKTVDQYLSFARKSEEPIPVDLATLVKKVMTDVRRKSEQTRTGLHEQIEPQLPQLNTDPLKVEQVLFNLVQNACEAFSKNVWVEVRHAIDAKDFVEITVKDDGPGIPASALPNIFVPLFTTKKAGSGLGLPICKKIIESLGGRISVESELKVGTTFKLRLPFGIEKHIPKQQPEPPSVQV
jgi:signal transduction histidine kinase